MMRFPSSFGLRLPDHPRIGAWCKLLPAVFACSLCLASTARPFAQTASAPARVHEYFFIDCSGADPGDGSSAHPWNSLSLAESHPFAPGDIIALKRGTVCHGAFAPQGSGAAYAIIRLTAYGVGPRPKIVAPSAARQAFLLFNQEYWQVDSLDISGGNTYGVFVTGDKGTLHHLYLKNLYVHDVYGGKFRNKDNGLVVVGPSSIGVIFADVTIDAVDAAHTNQWSGILVGGGSFAYKDDAPLNTRVNIRNSTVHDVYGDGIVLFRDQGSTIGDSAAWLTGMEPTQDVGTPNAIWTWTCTGCSVINNEAYLTDSPGIDGGAYDIDWNDHQNMVAYNYAHDTQGYCVAVFAAGYATNDAAVSGNLCIANGLSPRLAALQGAVYVHTWNGGAIRNLSIWHNRIEWDPRVPGAAAIRSDAAVNGAPIGFSENTVSSTSPFIYRVSSPWHAFENTYILPGDAVFTVGDRRDVSLAALQSAAKERYSKQETPPLPQPASCLRIEAVLAPELYDGSLLGPPDAYAQLVVLRSLAGQYGPSRLRVTVHLPAGAHSDAAASNALNDLNSVYPGALEFVDDASTGPSPAIRLLAADGVSLAQWHKYVNAATLGGAVRALLGAPHYSHMPAM